MAGDNSTRLSITSRGLHQQLVTGIALISIIPILVLWLRWASAREEPENPAALLVYGLAAATGIAGYALLRRSTDNVTTIRRQVENAVRDEGIQHPVAQEGNDLLAIQKCTEALVRQLRSEYTDLETRRAQLEHSLARATKLESLGSMAAGISHDLDNTFTAILGNTDIILRYANPDATTKEHVHQIESAANRALDTIRAIRLCAGRGTFDAKTINMSEFARGTATELATSVPNTIEVDCHLMDEIPEVAADPDYIRTVITNLVTNAAEAMQDRPGRITVSTGVMQCDRAYLGRAYVDEGLPEGEYVYIEVADPGPGIAPEVRERIFDPFYSGSIRGRGLGLALVMGIVRTHSGAVIVDSTPGKGATFRVVLPTNETRTRLPPEHSSRKSIEG